MSRTEGQALSGEVKYYSLDKGYGFITCDDGGGDCFVHQSVIITDSFRALMKGHKVTFSYTCKQGKDTAADVQPVPPVHYATKLDAKKASMKANRDPSALDGTVKWFNVKKGFGFIVPTVGEQEVFVHIGQIDGQVILTEGDEVEYKMAVDEKTNKQSATAVRLTARNGQPVQSGGALLPQGGHMQPMYSPYGQPQHAYAPQQALAQPSYPQAQAMLTPGQQSGTVKWFNEQKGFGFIVTATGSDIYVNRPHLEMVGGSLQQGETVFYETQTNNDGKTWAVNVTRPSRAPAPSPYMQSPHQQGQYVLPYPPATQPESQYAPQAQHMVGSKRKMVEAPVYANTRPKYGIAPQQPQYGEYMAQQPAQPQYY